MLFNLVLLVEGLSNWVVVIFLQQCAGPVICFFRPKRYKSKFSHNFFLNFDFVIEEVVGKYK